MFDIFRPPMLCWVKMHKLHTDFGL